MSTKLTSGINDDEIIQILLNQNLITDEHHKEIQVKKKQIKSKLEQIRAMRSSSSGNKVKTGSPVTIVFRDKPLAAA